jgi:hypothetical protein
VLVPDETLCPVLHWWTPTSGGLSQSERWHDGKVLQF